MKNLLGAIEALRLVSTSSIFDIYGPKEDLDYWIECERAMKTLPGHVTVRYCGSLPHEQVASTLKGYDLFLFPTFGENYGHVIVEALSVGVPVLLSDQTPWQDVQEQGVGWVLSGGAADFAFHIDQCAALTPSERTEIRHRCVSYARKVLTDDAAIVQNIRLFV